MKKLVKTAKQQFEERLSKLTLIKKYAFIDTDLYYLCEDNSHEMSILREINDKEFYEQKYAMPYSELISSEDFLHEMTMRFIEHHDEPVKPLFDWYASADKDNEPFTLDDIWMCSLEDRDLSEVFYDLYEEVPDVRIITAKEQWEEDSKNAKIAATLGNGSIYKVNVTEQAITFYVFKGDCYTKSVFPPLSELRKDNKFIIKYLELVRMSHDGDMDYALSWLAGGEYKMCELSLLDIYESATEVDGLEYEDKELPQEQTTEKKDFSDRFSSLKSDIIANIGELCENGASIDTEALFESYSIVWIDGAVSYFEDVADFSLIKTVEGHWKYGIEYGHDKGKTYDGRLELLTLESLLHILDSLH